MERESELQQNVANASSIEGGRKTLSPILFQQLRKKFGSDIHFRAQTPIVNDALQVAAAAKKTSRAKKRRNRRQLRMTDSPGPITVSPAPTIGFLGPTIDFLDRIPFIAALAGGESEILKSDFWVHTP